MKRIFTFSIIALALLLSAAPMADAKVKKSTRKVATSNTLPNAKTIIKFHQDGCKNKNTPEIKQLAKKGDYVIYGNNVKVTITGDYECKATAEEPHAWYTDGCTFYFKSKADRDKIFKNKYWYNVSCCGAWTNDSDGWYNICTCH